MRPLILFVMGVLFAQDVLTNDSIVKLVQSGMSEELILNVIRQQPGSYSLGAEQMVSMKSAGVSEKVIAAMLAKTSGDPMPRSGSSSSSLPSKPGVFYNRNGEWLELISETVDWKNAGNVKNFVSIGIVKKELKGSIPGSNSRNLLPVGVLPVIVPVPGTSINEYLLIPMKSDKNKREFQVKPPRKNETLAEGAVAFGLEKIDDTHYRVAPAAPLAPGEYGILPLSALGSETGMSRMYTFRRLEKD